MENAHFWLRSWGPGVAVPGAVSCVSSGVDRSEVLSMCWPGAGRCGNQGLSTD